MRQPDKSQAKDRKRNSFLTTRTFRQSRRLKFLYASFLAVLCSAFATRLLADTLSGTVKDPSGAVVSGARIEISGANLAQPLVLGSDESGKFSAPHLAAGKYSVRVSKDGFNDLVIQVDLKGNADLPLNLTIPAQQTSVTVTEKSTAFANSDPVYLQLRNVGLGETFRCEDFTLTMDVGTFHFKSGTITLLAVVNKSETGAVFIGQGHFTLKPIDSINTRELARRVGSPTAEEDFTEVVFRFTGGLYPQFAGALGTRTETPPEAAAAFQHWKDRVRHRHEIPAGFTQAMLEGETIDNVDADVLSAIYNPKHPPFFNAYIRGTPHKDLRFFVRTRVGAISELDSPEEVALLNCDGGELADGVWYSEHLVSEVRTRTANSLEDKRLFATKRYNIETVIAKNDHLYSRAVITFEPLVPSERILKFGLLPNLRVTRVTDQNGHDLHFIQEDKKLDGSFYTVLDEPPSMGTEHSISVEYAGDKVLASAGNGSYYVSARESW